MLLYVLFGQERPASRDLTNERKNAYAADLRQPRLRRGPFAADQLERTRFRRVAPKQAGAIP